jgi:hypothetical protein
MAAAQRTLLAYPQFHAPSYRPVELGNEALEGIWMLRHAGEPELAWPLLELCAGLDTGSAAQMRCQELMALVRGDYASAENHALRNYQRYPGYDTPASYIVYRFLLGRQTEAWAAFDQWSSRGYSESMQPVAVLGEQLQGGSDADIAAAAARWPLREAHVERVGWRRDERLFRALFPDRVASTDTVQLLQRSASSSSNAKFWVDLARGYLAFQGRDYQGALEAWRGPDKHLTEQSYQHDRSMNFLIPYIALAYALGSPSGSSDERLSGYAARFPDSDEAYAIETIRAATAGRPQAASEAAWKAFLYGGYSATQAIHGRLVLFEILEALLEHTRDDRYRELLVDLATRHTRFEQDAFAYAFMAKYTRSDADRQGALARALFLNRQSIRLKEFSDAQRREAGAWQAARGPSDRP